MSTSYLRLHKMGPLDDSDYVPEAARHSAALHAAKTLVDMRIRAIHGWRSLGKELHNQNIQYLLDNLQSSIAAMRAKVSPGSDTDTWFAQLEVLLENFDLLDQTQITIYSQIGYEVPKDVLGKPSPLGSRTAE